MRKASYVVPEAFQKNAIFDLQNSGLNRDNCLLPHVLLKEAFFEKGFDLSTSDINGVADSEAVIYLDMPVELPAVEDTGKSYLLLFETELIRPDNWVMKNHERFDKIFTWRDELIDNKKYFKLNFPNNIQSVKPGIEGRNKLACLISGNKTVKHPLELYSERLKAIKWFEANHPEDFEYFGTGWNKYITGSGLVAKILYKTKLDRLIPERKTPCYRGMLDNKSSALERFRFAICYENAKQIPGYITEKIFDCFFSACVPVYWGAPNIENWIPKECFVNREDFSSNEDLYNFLVKMKEEEYLEYQKNIETFLKGENVKLFSSQNYVEVLTKRVLLDK